MRKMKRTLVKETLILQQGELKLRSIYKVHHNTKHKIFDIFLKY